MRALLPIPAQLDRFVRLPEGPGIRFLLLEDVIGLFLARLFPGFELAGKGFFRLIRDSEHVSYYATFDNFQVGVQQASSLVAGLEERFGSGPWNVELFGGSPDDNNAYFFYDGAMSVLQPLIDDGSVNIVSGQMGMDRVGTLRWDGAVAQARMDNLLSAHYSELPVHGVLSPYDGLSIGILSSLKGIGYGSGDMPMPIVTGQDAEVPSIKSILAGEQYSTVFKDTRELARVTVGMVDALIRGSEPEINDTETYHNGVRVVPSFLLEPVSVDLLSLIPQTLRSERMQPLEKSVPQKIPFIPALGARAPPTFSV